MMGPTTAEQRVVVRYPWAEGAKTGEIHNMVVTQCRSENCMTQRNVMNVLKGVQQKEQV